MSSNKQIMVELDALEDRDVEIQKKIHELKAERALIRKQVETLLSKRKNSALIPMSQISWQQGFTVRQILDDHFRNGGE